MNKDNNYAFYGSLRKGQYNYTAAREGMEYLQTVEIPGFKLYALNASYPCAIRTNDPDDILTVDLFRLNKDRALGIHYMELGAGYDYDEVEILGTKYGIYTFDSSNAGRLASRHVPGGDWVKYLQTKREQQTV
jgi:gamma-glutamylcyclotransferase (GGCT)/AIG2-like uncharacterized protein YtfP